MEYKTHFIIISIIYSIFIILLGVSIYYLIENSQSNGSLNQDKFKKILLSFVGVIIAVVALIGNLIYTSVIGIKYYNN